MLYPISLFLHLCRHFIEDPFKTLWDSEARQKNLITDIRVFADRVESGTRVRRGEFPSRTWLNRHRRNGVRRG
jgi:hypothetical protein